MTSDWITIKAADFIDFNPRLSLKKGSVATKVAMDKLQPFTKKIPATEKAEFSGGAKFCNGDTIMARITPCLENGKTAFVDVLEDGEVGFGSTEFIVLRAKEGISDPQFIYYLATSPWFRNVAIKSMVGSSGRQRVQQGVLDELELTVPLLPEQQKIGAFLAMFDEKIALNNKINDNLQQQAATIFGEWLLSCTENTSIGELSNNILDYTPITNEMVRLLNSSDVTEGVFPNAPLVPNEDLKGHFKKRFQYDDILYSEIRPRNHHYGYVQFDASEYIASTRLMVIRAITSKVSPALLYQYLLLPEVEAEFTLKTESRSGTFPQGNYADMASIIVPYSSIESQSEISATLSQIRKTIALNQIENQCLESLRDTLLPRLMNGKIDVSNLEI